MHVLRTNQLEKLSRLNSRNEDLWKPPAHATDDTETRFCLIDNGHRTFSDLAAWNGYRTSDMNRLSIETMNQYSKEDTPYYGPDKIAATE
jgi:hypothetical protein